MIIARRLTTILILPLALVGCRGEQGKPATKIEDPRSYAIASLQTMDLNTWWQAYRNPDPQLLGRIVDDVVSREPAGLPAEARRLDTFIRNRLVPAYRLHMRDTDEGKAYILAQAEARFADPPMALCDNNGKHALLDYHILPGQWRSTTRLSEGLVDPPVVGKRPFLKTDVLIESLRRLVDTYPNARIYQIRYQYHHGSDLKKVLLQFSRDAQIVYRMNGSDQFTAEPIPWIDLISGDAQLSELVWYGPTQEDLGPSIAMPPQEPLPSRP